MGVSYRSDTKKWVVRIRVKNENIDYTRSFNSKTLAKKDETRVLADIEAGTFFQQDRSMTLKNAIDLYMETAIKGNKKESTILSYNGYINNHIVPFFNDRSLCSISKLDCDKFVNYLREKNCTHIVRTANQLKRVYTSKKLSNETINHILFLLGAVFEFMVDSDVILKNPMNKVKKLPREYKEANFLTSEECNSLLKVAKESFSPMYYRILLISIITGMRQGEVLALTWKDIDFENSTISVNKTYSKGKVGLPKTKSSIRKVKIPQHLVVELKEHKLYSKTNSKALLFTNEEGNYIDPRNLVNRFLKPCLKQAGLRRVKWHELRHSCITAMAEQKVSIKSIQKQVGHSSEQTTLRFYTHATDKTDEKMVEVLDSAFQY